MKTAVALLVVALTALSVESKDLIVGTSYNNRLLWHEKAQYNAIPLVKRVKNVFYSAQGYQIIKGVIARDLDHTAAIPSITAGGIGFTYVNIRLKSGRGSGLNYQIEIYV